MNTSYVRDSFLQFFAAPSGRICEKIVIKLWNCIDEVFFSQTSDPVINTENDEQLILRKDQTLKDANVGE